MNERAKQFLPFDTLKGFKAELRKREKVSVAKKHLSVESEEELSYKLNQIKKGMIIKVVYYCEDEYLKCEGVVSSIDKTSKILRIVKTTIEFKNIYSITGAEIHGLDEFID